MALTAKQRVFVAEYLKDKNASRAGRAAGYGKTEKSTRQLSHQLLKNLDIRAAIEKGLEKQVQKAELTAAMVLAEIRKLAFADLSTAYAEDGTLLHPQKMPDDVRAALQQVETDEFFMGRGAMKRKVGETKKIKLADKVRSLEMLAKHFKLLTDVHEHSGKDGGPMVVLTMPPNESEAPSDDGSDGAPTG